MEVKLVLKLISSVISSSSGKPPVEIHLSDSMETIEEWDSLATVTLAAALDSEYGISIEVDDLESLSSVKGIMQLLNISS